MATTRWSIVSAQDRLPSSLIDRGTAAIRQQETFGGDRFSSLLEIRLVGDGDMVVDQNLVVLRADQFRESARREHCDILRPNASKARNCLPGLVERVRVIDSHGHLQPVAVPD